MTKRSVSLLSQIETGEVSTSFSSMRIIADALDIFLSRLILDEEAGKVVLDEILIKGSRSNPNVSEDVIRLFRKGILKGDKVVTHRFPLEKHEEAFDSFRHRKDGAFKVVVEP